MLFIPKSPLKSDYLFFSIVNTPLGKWGIATTEFGLCNIQTKINNEANYIKFLDKTFSAPAKKNVKKLNHIASQINQYFKGKLKQFNCSFDLRSGTPFQQRVWKKLIQIPYGETRSYSWLAKSINNPKACRAVGNANSKNPIPIIIPCHRVIQNNGSLGGYTGGLKTKIYLLDFEQKQNAPL